MHERLRNNVRSRNQDTLTYYYEMIGIGNHAKVADAAMIRYIINGINDHQFAMALRFDIIPSLEKLREKIVWHISTKPIGSMSTVNIRSNNDMSSNFNAGHRTIRTR